MTVMLSGQGWELIWLMLILKIPIAYLCWVVWWAVKSAPEPPAEPLAVRVTPSPSRPCPFVPRRPAPPASSQRRLIAARRAVRARVSASQAARHSLEEALR